MKSCLLESARSRIRQRIRRTAFRSGTCVTLRAAAQRLSVSAESGSSLELDQNNLTGLGENLFSFLVQLTLQRTLLVHVGDPS
jgi:hypothetical protein